MAEKSIKLAEEVYESILDTREGFKAPKLRF